MSGKRMIDLLSTIWGRLYSHRLRSFSTILGVVIGVAVVTAKRRDETRHSRRQKPHGAGQMRLKQLGRTTILSLMLALTLIAPPLASAVVHAASGTIVLSRTSGPPGSYVTVSGSGFNANETNILVTFDGGAVASAITADSGGSWTTGFYVPNTAAYGIHTVVASGPITGSVAAVTFSITSGPALAAVTISPTSGPTGTPVIITGTGFSANETVTITFDGSPVLSNITASSSGSWNASYNIPASTSRGSHNIGAYGSVTGTVTGTTFAVQGGVITVSPTSGASGTSITVSGTGFGPGETGIVVTFDSAVAAAGITANSLGSWTSTFVVPASASGSHNISASGSQTPSGTVSPVTFTVTAGLSLSAASGVPGTSVTVTGSGFGTGENGITVTYDGAVVSAGITANSQGGWKSTFVVPASTSGAHSVAANGSFTSPGTVLPVTFTITAGISVSPASGAPGTTVTVTGSGFAAGETGISVTYDGNALASGVTANGQGGWKAAFVVPASASGSHDITAYGSVTQQANLSASTFNIGSGISVDPAQGYVGETVTVKGSGFAANSPLQFSYDSQVIVMNQMTGDSRGSFTASITIPKSAHGSHQITVGDGQNNTSVVSFTIESTPPPVPRPISPRDGSTVGFLGSITPTFEWSAVTDPNGVSYVLQIDTTSDFAQPILEKTIDSGSHYTLDSADALPRGTYYWRVKAVDEASNESDWSQPSKLKSGLIAPGVLVFLILLVVAIIAAAAYFILVRRRPKRIEGVEVPEVEIPPIIDARVRSLPTEEPRELPQLRTRLSLPQGQKKERGLSAEESARLRVVLDFAQSLPLAEPGYTAEWPVELTQDNAGGEISPQAHEQLLKGELQARYEPAWVRHPSYQDLQTLFEGQPILNDMDAFVELVNRCASDAASLLRDIYHGTTSGIAQGIFDDGGWAFVAGVYDDAMSWFLGKSLRAPSERDYAIKPADDEIGGIILWGEPNTPFAEPLARAKDEKEAAQAGSLHLKLRRNYRTSEQARQLVGKITQLKVQRDRLVNSFSELSRYAQ